MGVRSAPRRRLLLPASSRKDCRKDFWTVGRTSGLQEGLLDCRKDFWTAGRTSGLQEGLLDCRKDFWTVGRTSGLQEGLLDCRKDFWTAGRTSVQRSGRAPRRGPPPFRPHQRRGREAAPTPASFVASLWAPPPPPRRPASIG
eukprot:gene15851-biopygen10117